MSNELEPMRKRIEEIDLKIAELMIERNDASRAVGVIKKEFGIALRNKDVEEKVIARYREAASGTSLSQDVAEAVCKLLIADSVRLQSFILRNRCEKKVSVIGGEGKMGKRVAEYFRNMGATVNIVDVSVGEMEDIRDSDIVVVSVPISTVAQVMIDADRVCKDDALIFDISSVKTPFLPMLIKMAERRKVCSVHPMFGPSVSTVAGKNVIICDCGNEKAVAEVKELFDNDGSNVTVMPAERHDVLMSYVLGLAHALNITFFTALRLSEIQFGELKNSSSSTFDSILSISTPVSEEDPFLYYEIQRLNKNSGDMWSVYEKAFAEVKCASLSGDPKKFSEIMGSGKTYLHNDGAPKAAQR